MSPMALCLAMLCWAALRCRADCGLANISIPVENEECSRCITVNTTSCAGSCPTQVGDSSLFTYPVAVSCECAPCKSDLADCGVPGSDYLSCQV
nr:PREDICTED: follitropin subunit beta [Lepisosteus oculatus]